MDFVLRGVDSDTLYTLLYFDSDSPFIWMSTGVSLRVVSGEQMIKKKKKDPPNSTRIEFITEVRLHRLT